MPFDCFPRLKLVSRRALAWWGCVLATGLLVAAPAAWARTPEYGVMVTASYPHDPAAFTEGLFYRDGYLYESTGLEGRSSVRKVRLTTGEVVQKIDVPSQYFGEGVVDWKGRLVELTWRNQIGFVYDLATFRLRRTFHYPGEGWALTHNDKQLIMSDGTPDIRFLDPDTLKETRRIHVRDGGRPVADINELEWVKGEILANIWRTNRIARINPATGAVTGWIDLSDLPDVHDVDANPDAVLNGIAYDAIADRLFVTGKLWPRLYEIKLTAAR